MIKTFKHKGLETFFHTGSTKGINARHQKKLRLLLAMLHSAAEAEDMAGPGLRFHKLSGAKQQFYSVKVSGHWRLTFRFTGGDAYQVGYEDYH